MPALGGLDLDSVSHQPHDSGIVPPLPVQLFSGAVDCYCFLQLDSVAVRERMYPLALEDVDEDKSCRGPCDSHQHQMAGFHKDGLLQVMGSTVHGKNAQAIRGRASRQFWWVRTYRA